MKTKILVLICLIYNPFFLFGQVPAYILDVEEVLQADSYIKEVAISDDFLSFVAQGSTDSLEVYIYKGQDSNWNFHQKLSPPVLTKFVNGINGIAMSDTYILLSAPMRTSDVQSRIFIYELINDQWVEQGVILSPDIDDREFGNVVNIHNNYAIVSSLEEKGTVFLYKNVDNTWIEEQVFNASNNERSFGGAIDVNDNWLAIGSYKTISTGFWQFQVYLYQNVDGEWIKKQTVSYPVHNFTIISPQYSAEISNDQLIISNFAAQTDNNPNGALKVFKLQNDTWIETQALSPPGFELHNIGRKVALGKDFAMFGTVNPIHFLFYDTQEKDNWKLIGDYSNPDLLNWFSLDIDNRHGIASSQSKVYIFDFSDLNSVSNNEISNIEIYPNPTSQIIKIKSRNDRIVEYELFNTHGQILESKTMLNHEYLEIDIKDLSTNFYWLKVKTRNGTVTKKILRL